MAEIRFAGSPEVQQQLPAIVVHSKGHLGGCLDSWPIGDVGQRMRQMDHRV